MFKMVKHAVKSLRTKRFSTPKFAAELADRFQNEKNSISYDMRGYGVFSYPNLASPYSLPEHGDLFQKYPHLDFVTFHENLQGTKWEGFVGWTLLNSLLRIYDGAYGAYSTEKRYLEKLKRTIARVAKANPEVFVDGVLFGQQKSSAEYRSYLWGEYIRDFSQKEDVHLLLQHPRVRDSGNHLLVQMSVALLKKQDPDYKYKEYPTEWLGSVYGHDIKHDWPPLTKLWGPKESTLEDKA